MVNPLISIEIEKVVISGLLQFPEIYPEVSQFLSEKDFVSNSCHSIIYQILAKRLDNAQTATPVLIVEEINRLNLRFQEVDNIGAYILEGLNLISINKAGVIDSVKELKKITARREIYNKAKEIEQYVEKSGNESFENILTNCDKMYGDLLSSFEVTGEPQDLFAGAKNYIEELGNNQSNPEIFSPYKNYQNMFGGYFPGDLVVFASAAKSGKSTLLLDLMTKICMSGNIKGLFLDTELELERVQRRMVASLADINEYYLKTGYWRKNEELIKKVRAVWPTIETYFNKLDHKYIANLKIESIISLIKHWYWKKVVPSGAKAIVCFDYFKLTASDGNKDAFQSSMSMGHKVDALKKLASELKIPIIAACQTNRSNEERKNSKFRNESGSAVGLSHEINKFASSVFLFQRKFANEIEDGDLSTHKLVPLYTRDLGMHTAGYNDLVKTEEGWVENFIEYKISNFSVSEVGTFKDRMKEKNQLDIKDESKENGDISL